MKLNHTDGFSEVQEGKTIMLTSYGWRPNRFFYCTRIRTFPGGWKEMLESEGVERCIPGASTPDRRARIMNDIGKFSKKDFNKWKGRDDPLEFALMLYKKAYSGAKYEGSVIAIEVLHN